MVNPLRSAGANLASVAVDLLGTVNKTGAVNNVNRRREDGTWSEGGNGAVKDGTFVRGAPQGPPDSADPLRAPQHLRRSGFRQERHLRKALTRTRPHAAPSPPLRGPPLGVFTGQPGI